MLCRLECQTGMPSYSTMCGYFVYYISMYFTVTGRLSNAIIDNQQIYIVNKLAEVLSILIWWYLLNGWNMNKMKFVKGAVHYQWYTVYNIGMLSAPYFSNYGRTVSLITINYLLIYSMFTVYVKYMSDQCFSKSNCIVYIQLYGNDYINDVWQYFS